MLRKALLVLFAVLNIGGLLFGAPGVYSRFVHGHEPANYGSVVTWGLWVASYIYFIYFIGLSAGSFLVSSLVFVFRVERFEKIGRLAILTALVTLLMALITIGLDLGHMERAWHVYAWPNFRSPMAWMIWLYTTYMALLFCEAYFLMRCDFYARRDEKGLRGVFYRFASWRLRDASQESRAKDMRIVQTLASIGLPLAIMFHGGVGALFGVLASRPMWHSGMYPVPFVLSAVVSGGAAITLLAYIYLDKDASRSTTIEALGKLVLGVLVFETLWEIAEIGTYLYGGMPSHTAPWKVVLSGPYPLVFWVGQVGFGSVLPIALLAWGLKKRLPRLVAAACLSIAVAFITVRLNMVIPPMSVEEIRGLTSAIASNRITATYFPSLMEWQVTFFVVGIGGLLLTLGWKVLPLNAYESDELKPRLG
jgi:molybdopterin-containing oxidoreductase family membrane subunit